MSIFTYDCEVTKFDWLVVYRDYESKKFYIFHNDYEGIKEFILQNPEAIYVGFNSKSYDRYIVKAIWNELPPEQIKELNDFIIVGGHAGWQYEPVKYSLALNECDLRLDMQDGMSLKFIEGCKYMNIKETDVNFNIDRPWTKEEADQMIYYCCHDVEATEVLYESRKDYLKTKMHLGKLAGIDQIEALNMTNAQLTARMLRATRKVHNDQREYVYPDNLKKEYIPQHVFDFFNQMYDKSISDKDLYETNHQFKIDECSVTVGWGGIHGAIPRYAFDEDGTRLMRNYDVSSYYPHLMTINGYTSRSIPSPKLYEDVLEARMKAKASGDKATNNALKLVCNTTYGATLQQFNDLFDPLMARSVCISGQLYLLEMAMHMKQEIPDVRIVQLNTDGIMLEFPKEYLDNVHAITDEWQQRTGFELEEDKIIKLRQKDVSNYVERQEGGAVKCKGAWLVTGEKTAGGYSINTSKIIVAEALREYLINDTPIEETINNCDDIKKFQIIAKVGSTYSEVFQKVDGVKVPCQKVNRVYATTDTRYGTLYKVKGTQIALVPSLPEHCLVDNEVKVPLDSVDKSFYIGEAITKAEQFTTSRNAKKGGKKMAETRAVKTNVYGKILTARTKILESAISKTGKNMNMSYKYFELDDLVPVITGACKEVGLLPVTNFTESTATLTLVDTDDPKQQVEFTAPFTPIEPIVSNNGKTVTNSMQAMGASFTYMRRYLLMQAFDICEPDTIDATAGSTRTEVAPAPVAKPASKSSTIPVSEVERAEIKKDLTGANEQATELQIKGLKNVLKKLKTEKPEEAEWIAQIAVATKSFTTLTKTDCEKLINKVQEKMA